MGYGFDIFQSAGNCPVCFTACTQEHWFTMEEMIVVEKQQQALKLGGLRRRVRLG